MVKKKDQATKSKDKNEEGKEQKKDDVKNKVDEKEALDDVEQAITELRQKAREDPEVDFRGELRKIQDKIADAKGQPRRPITAKAPEGSDDDDDDADDEEEEEDPDKESKELVNKRLTTCMLLALSFESDETYPRDFYEKLAESEKFKDVVAPITKEEVKIINGLIKEKKKAAQGRVNACQK